MVKTVYATYKNIGETPLEALSRLRKRKKLGQDSLTYAGRLDPMACGVLLVLSGKAIQEKSHYLSLPKTYKAKVVFGVSSDTGDMLGLGQLRMPKPIREVDVRKTLRSLVGEIELALPRYASVPVNGKPLWTLARAGKLPQLPVRKSKLYAITSITIKYVSSKQLLARAESRIKKVRGDFRQEKILKQWRKLFKNSKYRFQLVQFTIRCSSGTYVRSLAEELGKRLGTPALLYGLERMRVGRYGLNDCL